MASVASQIATDENVSRLTAKIIARADPLRNRTSSIQGARVRLDVETHLTAWKNIGKFEERTISVNGHAVDAHAISPLTLLELYNKEFVETFGDKILPVPDTVNVNSVTNPNGLYAQQSHVVHTTARPAPFYERALYRRLNDRHVEVPIDEVEAPFYRLDLNPQLSDAERKKRDVDRSQRQTYLDREGLHYRMAPSH